MPRATPLKSVFSVTVPNRLSPESSTSDPHTYLSLGGELRERGQLLLGPLFGLRAGGADAYLLHRLLLSGDLHSDADGGNVEINGRDLRTPSRTGSASPGRALSGRTTPAG